MRGVLKKLAGETAIYGLSSILARMVNFMVVPLYTRVLSQSDYGISTELLSYIAILQVVLVLGLETGCFRFANNQKCDNPNKPFSTALTTVLSTALLFLGLMWGFSGSISEWMGYSGYELVFIYIGALMAIDAVTAILFARLRYQQKALKFALFKSIKIFSELGANLLLFFVVPGYLAANPNALLGQFIPATPDFSYIIFAVFVSCVVSLLLFIPDIIKMKFFFSVKLWKQMMIYSLPLMIAALPGILNEGLDRLLFRFYAPADVNWEAELGVFQAAVKLAVIMNLFIQMFRYAAEPFFFARGKDRELLAKVMEYFVAFCILIFLGVVFYIDVIGLILGESFRGALGVVPIMLLAYMCLGMLFNVSMWYKLSGQTKYAFGITILGLVITLIINVVFMPSYSYWASAWAHLVSAVAMLLYCLYLGNKHYPIPYQWSRILKFIGLGLALFGLSFAIEMVAPQMNLILRLGINTVLISGYIYCSAFRIIKIRNYAS